MAEKLTRAQKMAEQYGEKLKKLNAGAQESIVIKSSDQQTLGQKEKLIKAREKLASFKDLLG